MIFWLRISRFSAFVFVFFVNLKAFNSSCVEFLSQSQFVESHDSSVSVSDWISLTLVFDPLDVQYWPAVMSTKDGLCNLKM